MAEYKVYYKIGNSELIKSLITFLSYAAAKKFAEDLKAQSSCTHAEVVLVNFTIIDRYEIL